MFGSLRNNIGIARISTGSQSIQAISMHKIESREISNRKYISKQYWTAHQKNEEEKK